MAGCPTPGLVRRPAETAPALFAALVCLSAMAQSALPVSVQTIVNLQDVNARNAVAGYAPAHLDQKVLANGVVNSAPFHFPNYTLVAFERGGYGAVLKAAPGDQSAESLQPGDEIEVEGKISQIQGMAVILPDRIAHLGHGEPPAAAEIAVSELQSPVYLGRLVRTEIHMSGVGDAPTGGYLEAATPALYKIFVPGSTTATKGLKRFKPDDVVQATGVAYQYCSQPPFDRQYQLLVNDPATIVRSEHSYGLLTAAGALALVLLIGFFLWSRERRMRHQRETLRKTYQVGEEILGASSARSILKCISVALPTILGVSRVHLYIFNRGGRTLDEIGDDSGEPNSVSLASPSGGPQAGAVACFHYRTLLVIPDIERSPFPITPRSGDLAPRSLMFVPMVAQDEVIGVLELDQDDRMRDFTAGEQELAQHLGNQIGVAIRLLDQRSVQEQLFRTEKLAAVGRLISGVVNELQTPLASICELAARAMERARSSAAERDLMTIAAEAQKASGLVARLVSFAAEQVEARAVSVGTLLRNLIEFREGDLKASGIRVRDLISHEPVFVLGSQGQLEQVFLHLLVHAEQSLAGAPQKVITVRTSVLGKRLLVEVAFSAASESRKPEETAAVLGVTRSVIAGHGGEVRLIDRSNADPRFEIDLPVTSKERAGAAAVAAANGHVFDVSRNQTALVIEPDESAQRQILGLLSARGYRVVPVNNADTALDLAQRMRFEVAFCSVHAPGLNWVELSERMQARVGAFVLLSDGYDAELCADFEGDDRFVLAKPVQEPDLDRVLTSFEPSLPSAKHGAA